MLPVTSEHSSFYLLLSACLALSPVCSCGLLGMGVSGRLMWCACVGSKHGHQQGLYCGDTRRSEMYLERLVDAVTARAGVLEGLACLSLRVGDSLVLALVLGLHAREAFVSVRGVVRYRPYAGSPSCP